MGRPVGGRDLVVDQAVGGGGVRNPQQGFRQAKQRDAFRARKTVGLQEGFEPARLPAPLPHHPDESAGPLHDAGAGLGAKAGLRQQSPDRGRLVGPVGFLDLGPLAGPDHRWFLKDHCLPRLLRGRRLQPSPSIFGSIG